METTFWEFIGGMLFDSFKGLLRLIAALFFPFLLLF